MKVVCKLGYAVVWVLALFLGVLCIFVVADDTILHDLFYKDESKGD